MGARRLAPAEEVSEMTNPRAPWRGAPLRKWAVAVLLAMCASFGLAVAPASAAATVDDLSGGPTPTDLAQSLAGTGVTVSNVTTNGFEDVQGGSFSSDAATIGLDAGVVLSSGNINDLVPGPNTSDGTSHNASTAGDADLDAIVAPNTTNDAAVLEFDFEPDADTVYFQYVFGSDEYNEYVDSGFNDVFAFLVNGTNCAVVGANDDPVSINTINKGNPYVADGSTGDNPALYRNNDLSDGGGTIDTELDGLTTVLTCTAAVNAGQTNHLKLAIADTSDSSFDSAVFIEAGSITTNPPEVCDNQIDDDGDGLIDSADPDCEVTPPPSGDETLSGTKYYDSNTNGQWDAGEPGIEDWLVDISDGGVTTVATEADGSYSADVEPGAYTVAEQQGGGDWVQTGNSVDTSTGTADVTLNPDGTYTVDVEEGESAAGLDFGNVCLGEGGAHTRGFWQNKNGKALFETDAAAALGLLSGLNLVNEDGSDIDPVDYDEFRGWIRKARAGKNSAYMLSAQLATMALNVHFGLVDGGALILAEGTTAANLAGFATVDAVITEADAALGADPEGDDTRSYQLLLSDVLDAANNNETFVQAPGDCEAPVFPDVSADLFADGSVSCAGADDTSKPAGTATFTPSQDKVVFTIDLQGVQPSQDYNVVISEDGDCDPVYFNPDGVDLTTDPAGDATFSGEFPAPDGTYNLLVNIVATDAVTNPMDREIATVDTNVVVL